MELYQHITDFISKGVPIVLVSVTDKVGDGPVEIGHKMIVTFHHEFLGTVGGGALEFHAIEHAKTVFQSKKSMSKTYLLNEGALVKDATTLPMSCGGKVTLFYEYIGPKEFIYIFGAGHVGQALTKILKTMPYHVTIIDHRPDIIKGISTADEIIEMGYEEYLQQHPLPKDSYAVVCTPSHKYDYTVVDMLLSQQPSPKYIGLLCSRKKLLNYLDHLHETVGDDLDLSNLYAPIGLDLGGGTPAAIAISITSEILSLSNQKERIVSMREKFSKKEHHYWKQSKE